MISTSGAINIIWQVLHNNISLDYTEFYKFKIFLRFVNYSYDIFYDRIKISTLI